MKLKGEFLPCSSPDFRQKATQVATSTRKNHGHRFPAAVISVAVRWYYRCQLSLRGSEELLFERGVAVSYETIRRWCDKFGACFAQRFKTARRKPGSIRHLESWL